MQQSNGYKLSRNLIKYRYSTLTWERTQSAIKDTLCTTHKLSINKLSTYFTYPTVALFLNMSIQARLFVHVSVCVWPSAAPAIDWAGVVNRSVWPVWGDKGVSISGPCSCQVRPENRRSHLVYSRTSFQPSEGLLWALLLCCTVAKFSKRPHKPVSNEVLQLCAHSIPAIKPNKKLHLRYRSTAIFVTFQVWHVAQHVGLTLNTCLDD